MCQWQSESKQMAMNERLSQLILQKIIIYHRGVIPENIFLEITGNVLIKDKVKGKIKQRTLYIPTSDYWHKI